MSCCLYSAWLSITLSTYPVTFRKSLVSCLWLNILYTHMQCYHNTSGVGPCWEEGHHLCWDREQPTVRRNQGPRVPWASLHILWGGQSSSRPHTYWSHVSSLWQCGVSWGTKSKWWLSTDTVCSIWSTLNMVILYSYTYITFSHYYYCFSLLLHVL